MTRWANKQKRLTPGDRKKLHDFKEFIRDVAGGKSQQEAYAERYGEVVYDTTKERRHEVP